MNKVRVPLAAFAALVGLSAAAAPPAVPQAQAWAEGFMYGFLQGGDPPAKVICAVGGNTDEVIKALGYIKRSGAANFRVKGSKKIDLDRVEVSFSLITPAGGADSWATLKVAQVNAALCLSDVFSDLQFADIKRQFYQQQKEQKAQEIFSK
jgi:hypothetical protein